MYRQKKPWNVSDYTSPRKIQTEQRAAVDSFTGLVFVNPNGWLVGRGERIGADVHLPFLRVLSASLAHSPGCFHLSVQFTSLYWRSSSIRQELKRWSCHSCLLALRRGLWTADKDAHKFWVRGSGEKRNTGTAWLLSRLPTINVTNVTRAY